MDNLGLLPSKGIQNGVVGMRVNVSWLYLVQYLRLSIAQGPNSTKITRGRNQNVRHTDWGDKFVEDFMAIYQISLQELLQSIILRFESCTFRWTITERVSDVFPSVYSIHFLVLFSTRYCCAKWA